MPDTQGQASVSRMMPKPHRIRALLGIWELDGEMVRLLEDPKSGVLVAVTCRAERVNPIRVISHGSRMIEAEMH